MGFIKTATTTITRENLSLDNPNDRSEVRRFEEELAPFNNRKVIVFGHELPGFILYLHENGLFRYTNQYPNGAVVYDNLEKYQMAVMKRKALDKLKNQRKWAAEQENERVGSMIPEETIA